MFGGQLLDVYFTRSFYKHILGVKVTFHDMDAVDPGGKYIQHCLYTKNMFQAKSAKLWLPWPGAMALAQRI